MIGVCIPDKLREAGDFFISAYAESHAVLPCVCLHSSAPIRVNTVLQRQADSELVDGTLPESAMNLLVVEAEHLVDRFDY